MLIRTDFSDEDAWKAFFTRFKLAEEEMKSNEADETSAAAESDSEAATPEDAQMDSDSDSEDEAELITVINPDSTQERDLLSSISNLTALRLLNDVGIRVAPSPPHGTKRTTPSNPLVDYKGWQEVYSGLNIWIYDRKSNTDQCVRVVSQEGDSVYGTAT